MATITCLNVDTISIILGNENISIEDIFNFISTCKSLYGILDEYNMFWKKKIIQRWPFLKKVYDAFDGHVNFKDQVKAAMKCRNKLRNYLSHLSEEHCYKNELIDDDLNLLYEPEKDEHSMNFNFFNAELINLLTLSSEKSDCDLTQKYYAKQVFQHMQYYRLKYNWRKFFSSCKRHVEGIVEDAAIVITSWLQPEKFTFASNIEISLNNITGEILQPTLKKSSKHPISGTPIEEFSSYDIDNNQWYMEKGELFRKILKHIENTFIEEIYKNSSFRYLSEALYEFFEHYFQYDDIPNIAIIFQSVGRELNEHCRDFLEGRNSFYLVWKPSYFQMEALGNLKGHDTYEEAGYSMYNLYNNEIRGNEESNEIKGFTNAEERNKKILKACMISCQEPKQRTDKIKFSVGQVVKFKNYKSGKEEVGVIIGWDDRVETFYEILSEKHHNEYTEWFINEIIPPAEINHEEIGRYFCRLEKDYYVPNQMLAKHYPYDKTVSPKSTLSSENQYGTVIQDRTCSPCKKFRTSYC